MKNTHTGNVCIKTPGNNKYLVRNIARVCRSEIQILACVIMSLTCNTVTAIEPGNKLAEKLLNLTFHSSWQEVSAVPLRFNAFHTQGLVKIGEYFYLSSVEVTRWPKAYEEKQGKLDRDEGLGRGHIFKFDKNGTLLEDLLIGEGAVYHPGGIDFDGEYIWVPVTEYRPHSHSIIYRVDPKTMKATEVFRFDDSIGAIVHDTDKKTLIGVNWDAREFYHWPMDRQGKVLNANTPPDKSGIKRGSHYIAYQDCQYIGNHMMLCSGHQSYKSASATLRLGGWEIIDLRDSRPILQIPIRLWSPTGAAMTNNPCTVALVGQELRAYFVPDDDEKAVLYTFSLSD